MSVTKTRSAWAVVGAIALVTVALLPQTSQAEDWPMWRFDAYRGAASPEQLPEALRPQWTLQLIPREQTWDDPFNQDLMQFDKVFEPIIVGDTLFIGFNDADKVAAYDLVSGAEKWRYYANGPVRMPLAAYRDKIYFTSDDGYLYCLDAGDGSLLWKFRGGPSDLKVLGNKRIVSMWPARGGAVVRDGKVYFAASIWPFMGTFIYALDAETGKAEWVNDETGSQYIKQPHSAVSFAGVAPQGALAATEDVLLIPGGRSVPAAFDRHTGAFLHFYINEGGKGTGGSFVAANDAEFFVHTEGRGVRAFELECGKKGSFTCNEPVLEGKRMYTADPEHGKIMALDEDKKTIWEIEADASGDLIKAGNRLYAGGKDGIAVIALPDGPFGMPSLVQTLPAGGTLYRLIAGNGRLVAVSVEGALTVYGAGEPTAPPSSYHPKAPATTGPARRLALAILDNLEAKDGYALCFGLGDGTLLSALLEMSEFHIVAIDPDAAKVEALREAYDAAGLHGARVAFETGSPATYQAPPYVAELIVVGEAIADADAARLFNSVRPYGGGLWYSGELHIAGADAVKPVSAGGQMAMRLSGPEGAGSWTHQYGDVANTLKSNDSAVKLPLGVLWFGGNSHLEVLPRHGHGPSELVINGRLFIEGMDSISARDVYTGRSLWTRRFQNLDTYGIYYTYEFDGDLVATENEDQEHYPGANARGSNFAVTEDAVYLAIEDQCLMLDPRNGETLRTFQMPESDGEQRDWGYIGVWGDVLLGGNGFANYSTRLGAVDTGAKKGAGDHPPVADFSASRGLVAFDRHTGERLWSVDARHAFYHNGIAAGDGWIFCLDRLPNFADAQLRRRGQAPARPYRVAAFNLNTGDLLWEDNENAFGSWLGYSAEQHAVFQGGAKASDRDSTIETDRGMLVYEAATGEVLWQNRDLQYAGPCILHSDMIITNPDQYGLSAGAFRIRDGAPVSVTNPITGGLEDWRIQRGKGCNYIVASENMLMYRDGAASYYDLLDRIGTGNLGGFKTGCTTALIAADGVLNAPDYTRTCVCSYQNQTSLALVPMSGVESWTDSQFATERSSHGPITRIGINFGAAGDRMDGDGTLWLEWPPVGGPSPDLDIAVDGPHEFYARHSSYMADAAQPWIVASGISGAEHIRIPLRTGPAGKGNRFEDYGKGKGTGKAAEAAAGEPVYDSPEGAYTVRLLFAEPEDLGAGARVFDVALQGETRAEHFDIAQKAVAPRKEVTLEFNAVHLEDTLDIALTPRGGASPLLSGVEIIRE